jgi:succinate dehydrogenase / fumarate reductase cytochrome b subunit
VRIDERRDRRAGEWNVTSLTLGALIRSTVGRKAVLGVTGALLSLFVVGHVLGNLLVFAGPRELNRYSALLHLSPELLWSVRAVLLTSVLLHIWAAASLAIAGHAARPIAYARKRPQASSLGSRTMRSGGVVIALFVVFHLLHLTTGTIRPAAFSETDVYANLVGGFRVPSVVAIYLVGMIALGMHLSHGVWAAFRSTGASRPRRNPFRRPLAIAVAACVWAGFTAIPIAIFAGWVR